jgi:hypothetical protein
MILLAFLLFALGAADFIGARLPALATICLAVIAVGVGVVMTTAAGIHWGWACSVAAGVVLWRIATSGARRSSFWSLVAVSGLAAVAVAIVAAGSSLPAPGGALVGWYDELPYEVAQNVSFTTCALIVAGALFLTETSNVIVRLALSAEKTASPTGEPGPARDLRESGVPPARAFGVFDRRRWFSTPQQHDVDDVVKLKGGRFIGPIERLFLLVLIMAGQLGVMAAVVAAKGIIRFPEISKDAEGSKAEYFLVGSFTSWALVVAVALLIGLGKLTA